MGVHGLKDVNCAIHKGAPLLSISACTKAPAHLWFLSLKRAATNTISRWNNERND